MTKEELRQKVQWHNQLSHDDAAWLLNRIDALEEELSELAPVNTAVEIKVNSLLSRLKTFVKKLLRL